MLIFIGMFYALGGAQAGALYSAGAALLTTLALVVAFFLYLPRSGVWKRLGQPMRQTASAGYVSSDDYTGLSGPDRRRRHPPAPVGNGGVRRRPPVRRHRRRVRPARERRCRS